MPTLTAPPSLVELLRPLRRTSRSVTGVEAGEDWVHVARCRRKKGKDGSERLWSFSEIRIEPEEDTAPDEADRRFRVAAEKSDLGRGGEAVCVINTPAVDIFPLNLRPTESRPLETLVVEHARKHFGNALENTVLDFARIPESARRTGDESEAILLFSVPREVVDGLLGRLESIGLEVNRLLTPACALAPRVVWSDPAERQILIATAERSTSVSVVQESHVLLERILPWGARDLVRNLGSELGLEEGQSRTLLTRGEPAGGPEEMDDGGSAPLGDALRQALEPDFQELVRETSGCVGYCSSFYTPGSMSSVILAGPLARCVPLGDYLGEKLGLPVRSPREGLDLGVPGEKNDGDVYAAAAAAALWPAEKKR